MNNVKRNKYYLFVKYFIIYVNVKSFIWFMKFLSAWPKGTDGRTD